MTTKIKDTRMKYSGRIYQDPNYPGEIISTHRLNYRRFTSWDGVAATETTFRGAAAILPIDWKADGWNDVTLDMVLAGMYEYFI